MNKQAVKQYAKDGHTRDSANIRLNDTPISQLKRDVRSRTWNTERVDDACKKLISICQVEPRHGRYCEFPNTVKVGGNNNKK